MKVIHTDQAPAAVGPYSQAIEANGVLYCSGQIAINPAEGKIVATTIEEQAEQVLKNLMALVQAGGSDEFHIVKTNVFITDMKKFAAFNAVYAKYFQREFPARACVEVTALAKGALVEIEAIAEVCRE